MNLRSLIRKAWPWAAAGAGALTLATLGITFFIERKLLYPKRKSRPLADVNDYVPSIPFTIEPHSFDSYDGCRISSLLLRPEFPNGKIVVVCHGIRHDKRSGLRFVQYLLKAGYTLLLMDFRNHGESGGHLTTYGYHEKQDLRAAIHYLRSLGFEGPLGVLGASMGAAVALQAAAGFDDIQALVLDSPFASLEQIALEQTVLTTGLPKFMIYLPLQLAFFFARFLEGFPVKEVSPLKSARELHCPLLLIHGDADTKIGSHHSELIYENANAPKELWISSGAGHLGTYVTYPQEYEKRVLDFFDHHLPLRKTV